MWYGFEDDWLDCDYCGGGASGYDTRYGYKWHGGSYCSYECLRHAWHEELDSEVEETEHGYVWRGEEFESWDDLDDIFEEKLDSEVELIYLYSAEDKADEYGEELRQFHRDMEWEKEA